MEGPADHGRSPCPWRIVDDIGGAFAMGAIGGSIWHAFKGAKNSPAGERFAGSLLAMKSRAPILGGNFAVWGGMFSAIDCSLAAMRQKEDPWNSILSGGLTGGLLAIRGGLGVATQSALFGGAFLALIEGFVILVNRMEAEKYKPVKPVEYQPIAQPVQQQQPAALNIPYPKQKEQNGEEEDASFYYQPQVESAAQDGSSKENYSL